MPPRGKRPGFKRGRNNRHYWIAKQLVRNPMGYPDECIALPSDADEMTIDRLCQDYTAALLGWIERVGAPGPDEPDQKYDARRVYDGSVRSMCRVYQEHPESDFHTAKSNTRRFYTAYLKILEANVGRRQVRNLTLVDVKKWYREWRKPAQPGGPERIDRAHDAIAMFRTVTYFCAALHLPSRAQPHCQELAKILEQVKFERGGARDQELTYTQATAFLRTARDLGERGVIPRPRALSMSIGVAAQFELLLRQKDIIGEYPRNQADLDTALHRGATTLTCGSRVWSGYFTWENIPGWRWRMRTSKSKYRSAADFDLTKYSLLYPLLEAVPFEERTGAVVKGAHGFPIPEHSYRKWFRDIAQAAGIPDEVWSMDARAGGATEGDEAGAALDTLQAGLTHEDRNTTLRYMRRGRSRKIAALAEARAAKRVADEGGQK
jgi:hypothetical protein